MSDRPIEELVAGDNFRSSIIHNADSWDGLVPSFHGWVIMDAFLAGIDWARKTERDTCARSTP